MAVVKGIKEKVHLPIYDSVKIKPEDQLRDAEESSTLRFFADVQGKTKLETNLQSASLLPHYNTFEARALRVVLSDLPPEFPDDPKVKDEGIDVTGEDPATKQEKVLQLDGAGKVILGPVSPPPANTKVIKASFELGLDKAMKLLRDAREDSENKVELQLDDEEVTLDFDGTELTATQKTAAADIGNPIELTVSELEDLIDGMEDEDKKPPLEQIRPNDVAGNVVGKFVYNTVTTLFVGEKEMIKMPTWFFPGGAGPYSEGAKFTAHGEPNPLATFRFAEPIFIDKQQNFRVEIEVPDSNTLKQIQRIYGPMFIWVVLDGYMTRDVQ